MLRSLTARPTDPAVQTRRRRSFWRLLSLLLVVLIILLPLLTGWGQSVNTHFLALADAFLRGRLDVSGVSPVAVDISTFGGSQYVHQGVFPAVLLLPFVAIFGYSFHQLQMTLLLTLANGWLLWSLLESLAVAASTRRWLITLLTLASPYTMQMVTDGPWPLQHATSVTLTLLALYVVLRQPLATVSGRCWLLVGLLLGATLLTRYVTVLGGIFFAWLLVEIGRREDWSLRRYAVPLIGLGLGSGLGLLAFLLYNYARFGNPFDSGFGYGRWGADLLQSYSYGFLSLRHVPRNLYMFFLQPPLPVNPLFGPDSPQVLNFPWLAPDRMGMGLFFASPALLFTFRTGLDTPLKRALWAAILLIFAGLMIYCWPGGVQFGYRYAIDLLPFALLLLGLHWQQGVSRAGRLLIVVSGLISAWGVWYFFSYYLR